MLCDNYILSNRSRWTFYFSKVFNLILQSAKKIRLKLLEKIFILSQEDKVLVLGYPKAQGLESIPEDQVSLRVNQEFKDSGRYNECEDDYWIFRLSTKGRVIGKISNNIFYILAVDPKFDLYKH